MTPEIKDILDAWNIEGAIPSYHRYQKERLKVDWYSLYAALERLNKKKNDI